MRLEGYDTIKKTVILTKNGAYINGSKGGGSSGIKAIIDYAGTGLLWA